MLSNINQPETASQRSPSQNSPSCCTPGCLITKGSLFTLTLHYSIIIIMGLLTLLSTSSNQTLTERVYLLM